jgi:hypothetical protein
MSNCNQATPDLSPEAMLELIHQCPPGPWPNAWGTWDNTIEAHRRLVDRVVRGGGWIIGAAFCRSVVRYGIDPSFRFGYGFRVALSSSGIPQSPEPDK